MNISYIPPTLGSIGQKMLENGNVANSPLYQGDSAVLSSIMKAIKTTILFIATNCNDLDNIFILIAILGVFCIMFGFRKLGTKMTSGSIFGYLACKVVVLCQ